MMNFMKRFSIKNNGDKSCGKTVSTATMSSEEYIKAVEGGILPFWADQELMRKTGIKDLFAEGAKVINEMDYDDACDCLARARKMIDMATYVCREFGNKIDNAMELNENEMRDFCSADTIRKLFIKAKEDVDFDVVDGSNTKSVIARLNTIIDTFSSIKRMTFLTIIGSSEINGFEMVGFKKQL